MTDWGREIIVDGKRPSWLTDDSPVSWCNKGHRWLETTANPLNWVGGKHGSPVWAIRLPADHWAYRAIDAGFEPWGGGDNAPDDWDGGDVLWQTPSGKLIKQPIVNYSGTWSRESNGPINNIIGYRRRAEPTLRTADEALQRMEALVRRMAALSNPFAGNADYVDAREIVKLLPEPPVDPDLIEARRIAQDDANGLAPGNDDSYYTSGQGDHTDLIAQLTRAIKRGRELADQ
jgi:hypothetical protein